MSTILGVLSYIFSCVVSLRHGLYDRAFLSTHRPFCPTLCVGSLSVGGAGKTPTVELLLSHFVSKKVPVAVLSRGYKRRSRGAIVADPHTATPQSIGDEPFQILKKYKEVPMVLSGDRVLGCKMIEKHFPHTQLVVMDDGFQHRALQAQLYLLLTPFSTPFYEDHVFPQGRLRDQRVRAKKAQIIVVTKCPTPLSENEKNKTRAGISPYVQSETPIFFSFEAYAPLVPFGKVATPASKRVLLITGIADTESLLREVRKRFQLVDHLCFRDHHRYTTKDIQGILQRYAQETKPPLLLTTEKDAVKLKSLLSASEKAHPWFYLPVQTAFLSAEEEKQFFRCLKEKLLQ